jgi:type IV pilus assembly protein PilV
MRPSRATGFSLIEVLIAIIVFSLGLLGVAALTTSAVKNGHNAYLRSQASFLADSMAERMRANPRGVWAGDYAGALSAGAPALPGCGTGASTSGGCDSSKVAQRDRAVMGRLIAQQLPGGTGNVACTLSGAAAAGSYGVAPVDGSCTIRVSWSEKRDLDNTGYGGTQSFELVIQP